MKSYHQKFVSETPLEVYPTGEISGFPVSPGMFDLNGATPLQNGVNFTIHTCGGTACELLLFHREEEEPFAVLPFPEAGIPGKNRRTWHWTLYKKFPTSSGRLSPCRNGSI